MKKTFPPMFVDKEGGGYHMSPAGVLVLAADTFYRLAYANSPERVESAKATMQAILTAARRSGYARMSQLTSALVAGERSPRVVVMANEACARVPAAAMSEITAKAAFY